MNLDKLAKVMMLTTSTEDGEALAAIRRANALLSAEKMNWQEFFKSYVREDRIHYSNRSFQDEFEERIRRSQEEADRARRQRDEEWERGRPERERKAKEEQDAWNRRAEESRERRRSMWQEDKNLGQWFKCNSRDEEMRVRMNRGGTWTWTCGSKGKGPFSTREEAQTDAERACP